jgi:hypothetical protein
MTRVLGHVSIYTQHAARKDYSCDGPHDTYAADPVIHKGDTYFRAALPPHSEIGNAEWWTMRLCWTCAPVELTTTARKKAPS